MTDFTLFYAERPGNRDQGEPYIAERGIFASLYEFLPYRQQGWEGSAEINAAADALLQSADTSTQTLDAQ